MTREEAEKYADNMTYRDAINNLMKAKSIPYRKATFIKVNELLKALEQDPCEDAISRQAAIDVLTKTSGIRGDALKALYDLPPVTPQYTEAEIQKMQDLESAEIQKAYEIGKEEGSEVLDKIRAEIDEQYDRVHPYDISCAEGLEMALGIIDKYKASPTGAESEG